MRKPQTTIYDRRRLPRLTRQHTPEPLGHDLLFSFSEPHRIQDDPLPALSQVYRRFSLQHPPHGLPGSTRVHVDVGPRRFIGRHLRGDRNSTWPLPCDRSERTPPGVHRIVKTHQDKPANKGGQSEIKRMRAKRSRSAAKQTGEGLFLDRCARIGYIAVAFTERGIYGQHLRASVQSDDVG